MRLNKRKINLELERLGWSKYRLAKEIGVKRQWIYAILANSGGCTLKTVDRIGQALGVDPKDLII